VLGAGQRSEPDATLHPGLVGVWSQQRPAVPALVFGAVENPAGSRGPKRKCPFLPEVSGERASRAWAERWPWPWPVAGGVERGAWPPPMLTRGVSVLSAQLQPRGPEPRGHTAFRGTAELRG
jgi:hypothetical protein